MTVTISKEFLSPLDVVATSNDKAATRRSTTYDDGFCDGLHHARLGKPMLCSSTEYGIGFYDGWKSIRYDPAPVAGRRV